MPALREAQRRFGAALSAAAGEDEVLPLLAGDDARNRILLSIYRATSIANATAALRLAYPVCRLITGDDYFDALARRYRDDRPSRDGDLNRYGEHFAAFLDDFEPVRELPYLPDVARLEWLVHRATMAADGRPAGGELFAGLVPEALADLRLKMTPGFALLASRWPVADIWLQHQADAGETFDIDLDRPQRAAVWRDGYRVRVCALDPATHALWLAVLDGMPFGEAWAAASASDFRFNLAAAVSQAIACGWLRAPDAQGEPT
ncbi:HvfC/BufC N-terminal domain-containing protein [Methyloversatilis discipulorum]|uniref:HvfC/BufC N-terminal domain-containing protein n=1 Tax=Methyloversatilis discipulorum TaxID=1119528 RepID=UPI001A5C94BE|nr:DNA-binding domain-containing protein [Methyloversatilis discipulorum]MBL8466715.1 putative DNA-binding domain-containing protein [Methyloversatilis discipulorum]